MLAGTEDKIDESWEDFGAGPGGEVPVNWRDATMSNIWVIDRGYANSNEPGPRITGSSHLWNFSFLLFLQRCKPKGPLCNE